MILMEKLTARQIRLRRAKRISGRRRLAGKASTESFL